jgi:hypothetical protein
MRKKVSLLMAPVCFNDALFAHSKQIAGKPIGKNKHPTLNFSIIIKGSEIQRLLT